MMVLTLIKFNNFSIRTKTNALFISLIISIFFTVAVLQGSYAISSEYFDNGNFDTIKFSGPTITSLGFDNKRINDVESVNSGLSNQQISLKSIGSMNTTAAIVDNNIYNVWSDNLSGNNEIFIAVRYRRWEKFY